MTIHVVKPSSGHGKSQSGEFCNLLQFIHDVSYTSVALTIMVVLLKCYMFLTQRHLAFLR